MTLYHDCYMWDGSWGLLLSLDIHLVIYNAPNVFLDFFFQDLARMSVKSLQRPELVTPGSHPSPPAGSHSLFF